MNLSLDYSRRFTPVRVYSLNRTFLLSLCIVFFTLLIFFTIAPNTIHWFIIPVAICGLLIIPDMLKWFKGSYDTFDPKGLFGLLGFYLFFLSPLLWVATNAQMLYVPNPPDWRPWLGGMAAINVFGLIAYHVGHNHGFRIRKRGNEFWRLSWLKFWIVLPLFLVITLLTWIYFLSSMGGIGEIIITQSQFLKKEAFMNKGWIIAIGRSFPMLIFLTIVLQGLRRKKKRSPLAIAVLLLAFFILQFLFDGLRGSRSSVICSLFIAAGIIHYFWRPLSQKIVLIGFIPVLIFAFFYGFYKSAGIEVLDLCWRKVTVQDMMAATGRTVQSFLLGDLSRVDIQAFLLYRLFEYQNEYDLQWGATYVGDVAILIPRVLWPNRPPTKVKAGTELMYGKGSYVPGGFQSTRVYGLAGEAMLNFHIFGVPLAFFIWGFLMGRYRRWLMSLKPKDLRFVLAPLFSLLIFTAPMGDLDGIIAAFFFHGFVLTIVLILVARRKVLRRI